MKAICEYSHLGGAEILVSVHPALSSIIDGAIREVRPYQPVPTAPDLDALFARALRSRGFRSAREVPDLAYATLDAPDFLDEIRYTRERVFVEVLLGGQATVCYDMAKFQYFFNESKADVGVEIVPCHGLHKHMSSGVSYGEQLIFDIERLKRHFPAVPVKVILVDVDNDPR